METVLTQVKTVTTRWIVPADSTLEDISVNNVFHVNIDKVLLGSTEVAAQCIQVDEKREYRLDQEAAEDVTPYPQDEDVITKCIHTLITSTLDVSKREETFRKLTELQHWIEGKKMDVAFESQQN
jgi:hypothetical protein